MAALTRRTVLAGLSAAAVLRPERAFAAWPERNISLIHGLTAGGGVDVSARVIAEGLSRKLGQQIVVEPKPGAAGTLAAAQMARATPDGYQLGWIPSGHAVTAATYKSLPYHPIDDFTIIGQAIEFPFVIVTLSRAHDPQHPRPDQGREGALRAAARRRAGRRNAAASADRIFLAARRHQDPGGAVPRRQPGAHRTARQAHRLPDRSADRADRPDQVRRAARHRRHRRQALCAAAGCRHHRRGRLPRFFRHLVDGHGRAGQAAARRSRRGSTRRSTR